jgi:hypothetical protein
MAGRTRTKPAKFTIEKIRAGLIVNRLEKHIFNHPNKRTWMADDMTASQVTAALGLLKKVHPDLASAKVEIDQPVLVEVLQVVAHKAAK